MKGTNIKEGPFIKSENTFSKIINNILISLVPIVLFAFYKNGIIPYKNKTTDFLGMFLPLIIIIVSAFSSFIVEYIYIRFIRKEKTKQGRLIYAKQGLLPGLLLGLIVSINTPIWLVAAISVFSVIVGKLIFGGLGHNPVNPSVLGTLFVSLIMNFVLNNTSLLNSYEITKITNFSFTGIGTYESMVKPYGTLWNFLFGTVPGILGTTSSILIIIGFCYLTYKKAIKWKVTISYVITTFIISAVASLLNSTGMWAPIYQILSGSLLFSAVYLATDDATSPTTPLGQVIYGIALGILTVVFRNIFSFAEATFISIIIMNLLSRLIDIIGSYARFDFKKASIILLLEFIAIIGLSLYIAEIKVENITSNEIIEKEI